MKINRKKILYINETPITYIKFKELCNFRERFKDLATSLDPATAKEYEMAYQMLNRYLMGKDKTNTMCKLLK